MCSTHRASKARAEPARRIGNVYDRAVLFPGGLLHSATRHFGSALSTGRLYQTFPFAVGE